MTKQWPLFASALVIMISSCSGTGNNDTFSNNKSDPISKNANGEDTRILVKIGVTDTSQYPITLTNGTGLSADIANALNSIQDEFNFTHTLIPTKRLQLQVKNGAIDIAAFHNVNWGWHEHKVSKSHTLVQSEDVFIALKSNPNTENIFDLDKPSRKVGVLGFHYSFLNGKYDQISVKKRFNMNLVKSEQIALQMVLNGRSELGIVSTLTLQYLKKINPKEFESLLISDHHDSSYERYYILLEHSPIKQAALNKYLQTLQNNGKLGSIYDKYGIDAPETFAVD